MSWTNRLRSRRWLARAIVLFVILSLIAPSVVSALTYEPTSLQSGTIQDPANGTTVISVQGFHFKGQAAKKKPARLVGVGPRGNVKWVHNGSTVGAVWFYDVDPLSNGNLLVTATEPGKTVIYEFNPRTQEEVWIERFDIKDTHDADLINGNQLLIANMRAGEDDRIFIYDRSNDSVVWEWKFAAHYNQSVGASGEDWTHVNDVDKLGEGRYLVSPRNFDQVIVVNRSTDEIEMQLGSDGNHDVLYEQHNPQYLESKNGTPTILVADSENDRIVEYAKEGDGWTRTWMLGGHGEFSWPRDADRLPNGNTLIVDSLNHRVIEVTPTGEIVWEFYAPWGTYDVERITYGDEPGGPTIRDQGASGQYNVTGSASLTPGSGEQVTFSVWLANTFSGTPLEEEVRAFAMRWDHVVPWIRPAWMSEQDFLAMLLAGLVAAGWSIGDMIYHRKHIYGWVEKRFV